MATFSAIRTKVVDRYKGSKGSTFTTTAGEAINEAVAFYADKHWWFTEGTATVTLAEDAFELTTQVGFPTDFGYMVPEAGIAVVQSQNRYVLRQVTPEEYDRINTEGTGRPYMYRELGNAIQVYPYADRSYTVEFRYIKTYADLSGDGDSNDFTNYAPNLIIARAMNLLLLGQGQDTGVLTTRWEREEEKQLRMLRRINSQRLATGDLVMNY